MQHTDFPGNGLSFVRIASNPTLRNADAVLYVIVPVRYRVMVTLKKRLGMRVGTRTDFRMLAERYSCIDRFLLCD